MTPDFTLQFSSFSLFSAPPPRPSSYFSFFRPFLPSLHLLLHSHLHCCEPRRPQGGRNSLLPDKIIVNTHSNSMSIEQVCTQYVVQGTLYWACDAGGVSAMFASSLSCLPSWSWMSCCTTSSSLLSSPSSSSPTRDCQTLSMAAFMLLLPSCKREH